ncbi:hypothetical protein [Massilia eurypsychrophila]|uniref:hypothetical protein n=1 Tax=Massilia eurypsychrophila TaxID=1485217 RepID=UPI0015D4E053|nr:hypothetical protein [Massilia eurypsychrophila]
MESEVLHGIGKMLRLPLSFLERIEHRELLPHARLGEPRTAILDGDEKTLSCQKIQ